MFRDNLGILGVGTDWELIEMFRDNLGYFVLAECLGIFQNRGNGLQGVRTLVLWVASNAFNHQALFMGRVKANLYEATAQRVFEILLRISKGVLMRNLGLNPYLGLRSAMCVSSWISRTPFPPRQKNFLHALFSPTSRKTVPPDQEGAPFFFSPVAQPLE
ncbi:hypothetical protein VNO77_09523 [Canavalia gladiata]|uniref:Uncharacterized protein n=1 Tax=Canavalia gladiata TaxID=3824 RepID=A0AAN9M999_CANGL